MQFDILFGFTCQPFPRHVAQELVGDETLQVGTQYQNPTLTFRLLRWPRCLGRDAGAWAWAYIAEVVFVEKLRLGEFLAGRDSPENGGKRQN